MLTINKNRYGTIDGASGGSTLCSQTAALPGLDLLGTMQVG
jgi:hypothetical protein